MPLIPTVGGFLSAATPFAQQLDPRTQDALTRQALLGFGTTLLGGATNPDVSGVLGQGLSRGLGTFQAGVGDFLEQERQRRAEELRERQVGLQERGVQIGEAREERQQAIFDRETRQVAEREQALQGMRDFIDQLPAETKGNSFFLNNIQTLPKQVVQEVFSALVARDELLQQPATEGERLRFEAEMARISTVLEQLGFEREKFEATKKQLETGSSKAGVDVDTYLDGVEGIYETMVKFTPEDQPLPTFLDAANQFDKFLESRGLVGERDAGPPPAASAEEVLLEVGAPITPRNVEEAKRLIQQRGIQGAIDFIRSQRP